MRKYINKKILIIIACAFFALLPMAGYPSQTKAADTSQYYGYQCKRHILEELAKHPEIPEWKQMETISKLSVDGYFWLTTIEAKKLYLHTHDMQNLVVLRITAQVEERYGWHVPSGASSVQTQQSISASEYYFGEAMNNYQQWATFIHDLEKDNIYEGPETCKANFLRKQSWRDYMLKMGNNNALDNLYLYWPDLKKQYGGEFTVEEKRRLEQIWNVGGFDQQILVWGNKIRKPLSIGITGNSPIDDVLFFAPPDKVLALAGKYALKPVAKAGSWVLKKAGGGIAEGASRVLASKGLKTLISKIVGRISGRTYEINLARIFIDSSISINLQRKAATNGVQVLEGLANLPSYRKYFTQQEITRMWKIMKVLSDAKFEKLHPKLSASGFWDGESIVIKESIIERGYGEHVMIHESMHARSSISKAGNVKNWVKDQGRYPLGEGFTETLTQDAMLQINGYPSTVSWGYNEEQSVVRSIRNRLIRKWSLNGSNNQAVANVDGFLRECYFESPTGDLSMLDQQFGTGFHDIISAFMSMKNYSDANSMIESWVFPIK